MNLAACRSAFLQNKIVMRFGCCLVAISMIMSCWATPKAKAVATETALLGSIFGSLLVSLGYSWAADNFDAPSFGEAIYDLIKQCDEEMDTGIQLLIDSNLTGLVATGPGKLQLNYQWVSLARSFAEWFQGKFFASDNTTAVLTSQTKYAIGDFIFTPTVCPSYGGSSNVMGYAYNSLGTVLPLGDSVTIDNDVLSCYINADDNITVSFTKGNGHSTDYSKSMYYCGTFSGLVFIIYRDSLYYGLLGSKDKVYIDNYVSGWFGDLSLTNLSSALSAEKPQEVHYPDVAEDGSEVYEVTYQGVTATDIEGIIQGAVDQILAGTAAIAGEVTQAQDVPAEPEVPPELDGLDLPALGAALTSRFPFSIPWDVARGIGLLAAPAETPHFEVDFFEPISDLVGGWKGSTKIVLDFSEFEIIGRLCRWTSTIGFCLMLAAGTKRLIWVA